MIFLKRHLSILRNIAKSIAYDIYYSLTEGIKIRAGAENYAYYRSIKRYGDYLKRGAALDSVMPLASKYCIGKGVDIGASRWPLPGARPIENGQDENAYRISEPDGSLDFIFSSHTLEHLHHPEDALKEWCRKLRHEGILFLYLPHPACEMWRPEVLKYHVWSPDPVSLEKLLTSKFDLELQYITYLPDGYFSFVLVAMKKSIT